MWIKVKTKGHNTIFQELNLLMLLTLLTGSLAVQIMFWDFRLLMAFLIGGLLAYLNFTTLKKEGTEFLHKVYNNVMQCLERPYQKERTLFLLKVYLRLIALGVVFYFLIKYIKLHPVFLILGFTLIYFQIFVVIFRKWVKRKESF